MKAWIVFLLFMASVCVGGVIQPLRDPQALHFANQLRTMTDGDATPDVSSRFILVTANTGATTITGFDGGATGQVIFVIIGDGNTTFDFTGTNLKGNGGFDYTASENDFWVFAHDGTLWYGSFLNLDLVGSITGTANRVTVADDGDGTITLTGPQDIHTGASPTFASVEVNGNIIISNGNELRLNDVGNSHHVGFEAPALTATQIWVLPDADGNPGSVLTTDGSGATSWSDNASEKSWPFMSRDASSGTNYVGGFYKFGATDNDFNPVINHGTANVSYAAHFFLVQAAGATGGTDTVIRITGTTIDDQGNRATGVNVDLAVDDAGAAGTYYETTQKWLGQVTITKISGPDLLCNYGYCKYWDNNNTDFKVAGIEATWLGAKNDATPDIELRHHKATGWTYNNAAAPTPPTAIASMATDHNTEIQIATAEEGAWKRDNLSVNVDGSGNEGTIIELTTTTNRTYAIGNFLMRIVPQ